MKYLKYYGFMLILMCGCQSSQQPHGNDDALITKNAPDNNSPKIVFYNLQILSGNDKQNENITLINTIISKGKLKSDFSQSATLEPNHLLCSFLDENNQIIKQTVVENPISKYLEYADENGALQNKKIELDEGEFTLRTQFNELIIAIKIEKISNKLVLKTLKTIKL